VRWIVLMLALLYAPAAVGQRDEDHELVCPLLTPELVKIILPEVIGHGHCGVRCFGCGCQGGPGYRAADGKCVAYANIIQKCGPPPHVLCHAECKPVRAGCDHGRVWLKTFLSGIGLSVRFIAAEAQPLSPAQQPPLQDADQARDSQAQH
jgi:hypothetical protein